MPIAQLLLRMLAKPWGGAGGPARQSATSAQRNADARRPHTRIQAAPLQWRTPWAVWQVLSWAIMTLLAPPFWIIGTLLLINPRSDQPLFWASVVLIVPVVNGATIMQVAYRHHRRPFARRREVMLFWLKISLPLGCLMFLLAAEATGMLNALPAIKASSGEASLRIADTLWTTAVVVGYGALSFVHAGALYAWLALRAAQRKAQPDLV